jgi:hypothetical protein
MTNMLPATMIEAEALAFAAEFLARGHEGDGLGPPPADPAAGHAFMRQLFRAICDWGPQAMNAVVELAERHGESAAHEALLDLRDERIERNEPLGAVLGAYVIALRTRPFRPHRGWSRTNVLQDLMLVVLMLELVERFGLKPTRSQVGNLESKPPSAASIAASAAAAANMNRGSEKAFHQLWLKYSPRILPGYQWPNRGKRSF